MEYVAGLVQRLDLALNRAVVESIAVSLPKMGQTPFEFRDPAQKRTDLQLSGAGMMLSRYEFARYAVYGVDPERVAASMTVGFPRRPMPNVFITLLAQRLGIAALTAATRNIINEFLGSKSTPGEVKREKVLGAIYLLTCSPEYQGC